MAAPDTGLVDRLPHGPPALLLTDARLDPGGTTCTGLRKVPGRDPLANPAGFFPDCLLVELMAQTSGLILPGDHAGAYVAGIRELIIHASARDTDSLEVKAVFDRSLGSLFLFNCRAESSGRLLATGTITLRAF